MTLAEYSYLIGDGGNEAWVSTGDPVRVAGKQGLWRFVKMTVKDGVQYAEVVGPYKRSDPAPLSRVFEASSLRPAKKARPEDVGWNPAMKDLSDRAKRTR